MKALNWVKNNKILLILIFVSAILRLYKLTFQDIWIDEIFSMIHSSPSKRYTEIYEFLKAYDPHPPLYYYSIRFFSGLFEHSVFIVRAFSAVLGVAGILSIYALGKELMNKNVGLIAAALLVINSFHIYYSQEARMYSMLFLTTTLSFYYLVKFIKTPNLKWAFAYTIFSSAMIYTHFFGLFTLVSQYLILLFFILKPFENNRKRIFLLSLLTGLSTIIIYIPAIKIIMVSEQTTSYWIQLPEADFFTQLIKKFFGNSEIVLYFVVSLILYFLLKLYQQKSSNKFEINPTKKKLIFTFFIIMVWIVTTYSIPLILSFVKLPMLIDRYFINILPAILLLVACGLYKIKDIVVQIGILSLIILFSLINLIFVKDYYNTVTKSEFTKLTDEIIKRNSENSKIVTHMSWLLPYFFEKHPKMQVENNNSLDDYIEGLKNGAIFPKAFWYADGHFRPFQISIEHQEYLNQNFILKEKLDYFDVWANYYVPKNNPFKEIKNTLDLALFNDARFDENGFMLLFENATKTSNPVILEKGDYSLIISGYSTPIQSINKENAHIIIKKNNSEIASFNLSENPNSKENRFKFSVNNDESSTFQIIFDNDTFDNGMDRNAVIKSINIEKK